VDFSTSIQNWYRLNKRDLPWRTVNDPYKIWLSEVILQQTRIEQGTPYYLKFIQAFPTVKQLANASEDKVLNLWQGLGYYSRARNLHHAAKTISSQYKGQFPKSFEEIRALKGIGDYTASAVASIAFNLPHAVVDGNVYRVLSRVYKISEAIDSGAGKKTFAEGCCRNSGQKKSR
jgi:A/G-specific adenine glycosylase